LQKNCGADPFCSSFYRQKTIEKCSIDNCGRHAAFLILTRSNNGSSVTYKITVQINEKNLSTEAMQQAVNYISEALSGMQIAHTIECQKDKMVLLKMSKPPVVVE
jgi:hypothetical protein